MLELTALILAGIHFLIPLTYYYYAKTRWLPRSWNIKVDPSYRPRISVIIPTYNEAELIEDRLDNIYKQNYPKDRLEVIVVDDNSDDETVKLVKKWSSEHPDLNIRLVEEDRHRGKLHALKTALREVSSSSEVIVFTDADAFWERSALSNALSYFADSSVGSVSGSITYITSTNGEKFLENTYRRFYNLIRIAESKRYATPIHNGPFLAIRASLLRKFGLPDFAGSDDSAFGSFIAFTGHRAIQVDDVVVREPVRGSWLHRKVRRGQLLLSSFLKTKQYAKKLGVYKRVQPFEKIWKVEWWLNVINPWLLLGSTILLVIGVFQGSITALVLLGAGLALLLLRIYRTWILQQIYLIIAAIRNPWTKVIMWSR